MRSTIFFRVSGGGNPNKKIRNPKKIVHLAVPLKIHWTSLKSIDNPLKFIKFYVINWKSIEFHGNPLKINWISLSIHWNSLKSNEIPFETHWNSIENPLKFIEINWNPMNIYWNSLNINWNPLKFIQINWKSIDFH